MLCICFVFLQNCTLIPKGIHPSKENENKFEIQIHKLLKKNPKGFTVYINHRYEKTNQ